MLDISEGKWLCCFFNIKGFGASILMVVFTNAKDAQQLQVQKGEHSSAGLGIECFDLEISELAPEEGNSLASVHGIKLRANITNAIINANTFIAVKLSQS
jgi:hypothetical protein